MMVIYSSANPLAGLMRLFVTKFKYSSFALLVVSDHQYHMPHKHSPFFIVFLISGFYMLAIMLVWYYIPLYLAELGFSGGQIGALYAVYTLPGMLFVFLIGMLSDRISPRIMVSAGLVLVMLFLAGLSLGPVFAIGLLLFFLGGLGVRIFNLSIDGFTLKEAKGQVGKLFGKYTAVRMIPN